MRIGGWKKTGCALAVAALLMSGCSLASSGESAAPVLLKPVKDKVELLEVKRGSIVKDITGVAVLVPRTTQYLSFQIDGTIGQVFVKPGDHVKKGDQLIQMDEGTMAADILNQEVQLETAKATLEKDKVANDSEAIKIDSMTVEVEQMKLDGMQQKRQQMKLFAPADGVITFVEPGLAPNSAVAAYHDVIGMINPRDLQAQYMAVTTSDISGVDAGMPVSIDYKGKTYQAKVTQTPATAPISLITSVAEQNSRTLLFDFDKLPPDAAYGDNVSFDLVLQRKDNVITIPRTALRSYQGRDYVHVMDGETRKEIDVQKGIVSATDVEITKGLTEGMKIILNN